jgi:hypothetical protein
MYRHEGEHEYEWNRGCGANVCIVEHVDKTGWVEDCRDHDGLARCYCGWAKDGGDGRAQLQDMGENVDEDY